MKLRLPPKSPQDYAHNRHEVEAFTYQQLVTIAEGKLPADRAACALEALKLLDKLA